jgi:DNA ligase (NAD+)
MNTKDLEKEIINWEKAYREGKPLVSDKLFDEALETLKELRPDSFIFKEGILKQSQQVSRKEKLPIPMYSLNKVKSLDEVRKWLKSNNISEDELLVITPKYDGISLLVDEYSLLINGCWTRGDGEYGQASTAHFTKIGQYIRFDSDNVGKNLISFGEAIMSNKNFEKYKDKFANPRNMVAGLFNRDEVAKELIDVDYIRYGSNKENLDKRDQLIELNKINKVIVTFYILKFKDVTEEFLNEIYKVWSQDYKIDGLVIDINDAFLRKNLGREENFNPKYARAYKNPEWSSGAEVKVLGITWQVSKQGKLKPVINIEPTEVGGVIIENVTGYNASYVFDNNIAEGSFIEIIRSGDVIPKHIKTLSYISDNVEKLIDDSIVCPCCNEQVKWDETFTELVCVNPVCKDKEISKLVHFFQVLEIEEFGEPSIRKIYESGFKTIENILSLDSNKITLIEGFGEKSANKLLKQFKNLKDIGVPLAKLLHALDVFEGVIGEKICQKIFDESIDYNNLDEILKVEGVAERTADVFLKGLKIYIDFNKILGSSIKIKNISSPKILPIGNKYKGLNFCFTGCRPTKELEEEINKEGGSIISGVSKNTTHLVVKDLSDKTLSSNKAIKAKELNIVILTLNQIVNGQLF